MSQDEGQERTAVAGSDYQIPPPASGFARGVWVVLVTSAQESLAAYQAYASGAGPPGPGKISSSLSIVSAESFTFSARSE